MKKGFYTQANFPKVERQNAARLRENSALGFHFSSKNDHSCSLLFMNQGKHKCLTYIISCGPHSHYINVLLCCCHKTVTKAIGGEKGLFGLQVTQPIIKKGQGMSLETAAEEETTGWLARLPFLYIQAHLSRDNMARRSQALPGLMIN